MYELLKIEENNNNDDSGLLSGFEIFKQSYIDPSEDLEYPPVAISMGYNGKYPIPIGTYGNFSCLVAASKSKKTFLKSLIVSSYLAGQTGYASQIKGYRENKFVIDIDTEQGKWHAQNVFRRPLKIINNVDDRYLCFATRRYTPKERIQFIDWLFYESEYKDNIGLISIDGIADLVNDVNDLKESNSVMQKVLKWTDDSQCHLLTILHKNFGSEKPTGHLGSAMLKKAETALFLTPREDDNNLVDVSCKYSRGYSVEDFTFTITDDGLPMIYDDYCRDFNIRTDQTLGGKF